MAMIEDFYISFLFENLMFALLKVRKSSFSIISILILTNKEVIWKNPAFLSFFSILKLAKTILNILRVELLIFWAQILVKQTLKLDFNINTIIIILILLPESIKDLIFIIFFSK